jgi:hypothetical protein
MAIKQVRETAAGKSVSAFVVLNKKGEHVATVNAYFPNGGGCTVDVWNLGQSANNNAWAAAIKSGKLSKAGVEKALAEATKNRDWVSEDERAQWAAFDLFGLQQSRGNDIEGALAGLVIDGQYLFDHCGKDEQTAKLLAKYQAARGELVAQWVHDSEGQVRDLQKIWDEKAKRIGASFANYQTGKGYTSLFMAGGLRRLQDLGYTVIQAI